MKLDRLVILLSLLLLPSASHCSELPDLNGVTDQKCNSLGVADESAVNDAFEAACSRNMFCSNPIYHNEIRDLVINGGLYKSSQEKMIAERVQSDASDIIQQKTKGPIYQCISDESFTAHRLKDLFTLGVPQRAMDACPPSQQSDYNQYGECLENNISGGVLKGQIGVEEAESNIPDTAKPVFSSGNNCEAIGDAVSARVCKNNTKESDLYINDVWNNIPISARRACADKASSTNDYRECIVKTIGQEWFEGKIFIKQPG